MSLHFYDVFIGYLVSVFAEKMPLLVSDHLHTCLFDEASAFDKRWLTKDLRESLTLACHCYYLTP